MTNALSRMRWLVVIFALLAVLVGLDRWRPRPVEGAFAVTSTGGDNQSLVQFTGSNTVIATRQDAETVRQPSLTANYLAALPRDQFRETLSRPLFTPSRSAYKPQIKPVVRKAVPRAIVRAKLAPNSFVVMGVMTTSSARVAILYDKARARSTSVRQGDQLDSWRVARIDTHSVTLQRRGRSLKLLVFPQKNDARSAKTRSDR